MQTKKKGQENGTRKKKEQRLEWLGNVGRRV